jgi:3-isopropylmalate dehydrogenase
VAFGLARGRRNKVTSCEKSNVMETGQLWREVITALHARDYAAVTLEHMLADNAAMQLVRNPRQFDVIVTDNLFGDMLSDEAAMLTGSIGLLPSAAILSFEMALRWSLGRADLAQRLWGAVKVALEEGARTRDIGGRLGTNQMGDAVLKGL